MLIQIRKVKSNLSEVMGNMSGNQKSREEINITYMMMCIVTVFLITQLPFYLTLILWLTGITKSVSKSIWIFATFNSTVNTIIYCIFNKKFRDNLFQWLPTKLRNRLSSDTTLKSNKEKPTNNTTNDIVQLQL